MLCDSITKMLIPKLRKKVKILNPINNGSDITSRKRADEYVRTKRAYWVPAGTKEELNGSDWDGRTFCSVAFEGPSSLTPSLSPTNFIRFFESDPRNLAARERAEAGYSQRFGKGNPDERPMTVEELAN